MRGKASMMQSSDRKQSSPPMGNVEHWKEFFFKILLLLYWKCLIICDRKLYDVWLCFSRFVRVIKVQVNCKFHLSTGRLDMAFNDTIFFLNTHVHLYFNTYKTSVTNPTLLNFYLILLTLFLACPTGTFFFFDPPSLKDVCERFWLALTTKDAGRRSPPPKISFGPWYWGGRGTE